MGWIIESQFLTVTFFGVLVFVSVYFLNKRVIDFFHKKFLFTFEEISSITNKMLIQIDSRKLTIGLVSISYGLGLVVILFCLPNFVLGLLLAVPVILAGLIIPRNIMKNLWITRSHKIVSQMVDSLVILSNGVRSGLSISQSMERVIKNEGGPLGQEFQLALNKFRLGMPLEEALEEMADRIDQYDMHMFVSGVNILKETGGNMSETFDVISETLRERSRIQKKIEAMMTQSRNQGRILSVIPLVVLGLILITNPTYARPLFQTTLGWILLFVMLILQISGALLMKKIADIKA